MKILGSLLDLFDDDDDELVKLAERAALRIEAQYTSRIVKETIERAKSAARPARGRLTRLAGRLAHERGDPNGIARAWLIEALGDPDPKTRRGAARSLGNMDPSPPIEAALGEAFDRATDDADKRVLALSLGKVGGEAARARLADGQHGRASVIADRELARPNAGEIALARQPAAPLRVWFHTRAGLEPLLGDELGEVFGTSHFVSPGVVETKVEGPLTRALEIRTASHFGFPLTPTVRDRDLAIDVARAVGSNDATSIFRTFTTGAPIRFRLTFLRGGHRRSTVWQIAELVRSNRSDLVNDPKESTWEVVVDDVGGHLSVELVPRRYDDDRFTYRKDLVAASSHPTIAAALARVAPRNSNDVVWDPFVGAGAELVERARLGPYARLFGTDIDARAVDAARTNIEIANVPRATIERADACECSPEGVTLILTNPPMGRRVQRGDHIDLLERFVSHAGLVLVPGGALVWLVPEPKRVLARAEASGLVLDRSFTVDMGGFAAELSVYVKGRRSGAHRA